MPTPANPLFVALDTTDLDAAVGLASDLRGVVGGVKVGKEFFAAHGPDGVRRLGSIGLPLFLDLKFHDIPNTVASAVRAVLPLRPFALNVHAAGGRAMLAAAVDAAAEAGARRPLVLGVTVLTSLDDGDLAETGVVGPAREQAVRLARLARECGLDGVVCSPREIARVRHACGPTFTLMTPGIRPVWSVPGDQKRVTTPAEAMSLGADYLVVGRPITRADVPAAAARRVLSELGTGGAS
jgi:orotidine-5'-phosphate decarboxylase